VTPRRAASIRSRAWTCSGRTTEVVRVLPLGSIVLGRAITSQVTPM
jgi:hypothetical protein